MSADSEKRWNKVGDSLSGFSGEAAGDTDKVRSIVSALIDEHDGDVDAAQRDIDFRRSSGELDPLACIALQEALQHHRSEHVDTFNDADDEFTRTMVIGAHDIPTSADKNLQVGSVLRDRFLLKERVAGGSMGHVYRALDRRLAEAGEEWPYVAVKVLSPELSNDPRALRALQQEATKGRYLLHNHIVRFVDLDRDDDLYFIVMEWLDGENLADILDRTVKLEPARALEIVRQIGDALAYAHQRGIVHADVKPANIMISPDGDAKLFDFGVARALHAGAGMDATLPGAITKAYSSMQVLTGDKPVPEDDVFSLACLLYRMIAGYRVFGPRNAAEAAEEGMTPQRLEGLSEGQWRALKKALSFSRVTRFDTVREFVDALNRVDEAPDEILVDRTGRFEASTDIEPRGPGRWIIGALVLMAVAGSAWVLMQSPPIENDESPAIVNEPARSGESTEAEVPAPKPAVVEPEQPDDTSAPIERTAPAASRAESVTEPSIGEAGGLSEAATEPLADRDVDMVVRMDGGTARVVLREDEQPLRVAIDRDVNVSDAESFSWRVVDFSGNGSPLSSGDLTLDKQVHEFAVGQRRQAVTLEMRSDPVREADQRVTLALEAPDDSVVATLDVLLEDDDQRVFEARLPANTVAFASGQASVSENDTAVQIDVLRYQPDATTLTVQYTVSDVTATADEDYFPPEIRTIEFAPGQRSARILVPLVQDTLVEGNEAFVLELESSNTVSESDIYQRIAIFIRDDD